jgi:hypothetical protein
MTDFVADAARSAAATLAPDLGQHLPVEVEAALAARAGDQRPDSYQEVASLGSVTVSAAAFAWTIYNNQRNSSQGPRPDADSIAYQVHAALHDGDAVLQPDTDRIIEVVATEIIRQSNLARE